MIGVLIQKSTAPQILMPVAIPGDEEALGALIGLPLQTIGRFGDILILHFGEMRDVPARSGGFRQVGDWCLNVETSWHFTRGGRILFGVLDFYAYADEQASTYDWNRGGESRFACKSSILNTELATGAITVREARCDEVGSIVLRLDGGLQFSVFPNWSSDYPNRVYWRLFQPETGSPGLRGSQRFVYPTHFIVSLLAPMPARRGLFCQQVKSDDKSRYWRIRPHRAFFGTKKSFRRSS